MSWFLVVFFLCLMNFGLGWYDDKCVESNSVCGKYWPDNRCCNLVEKCLQDPEVKDQLRCMRPHKLSTPCSENKDCTAITGGKCSENNTCICQHDFVEYKDDECIKKQEMRRIQYYPPWKNIYFWNYECDDVICDLLTDYQSESRQRRESELMYGESCHSDDDCKMYNLSSTACINGECRCRSGELFDYQVFGCKPAENGIGGICSNETKCQAANSYCDDFGTCRCKQYHYYKSGSCVADPHFECPEDHYFDPVNQTCSRYAQAINDYCGIDEGCSQVNISKTLCRKFKCQCPEDYIILNGACIIPISGKCYNNEDCTIPHSICTGDIGKIKHCQCDNRYLSNNKTLCLDYTHTLHGACENDQGCHGDIDWHCNGTNCVCNENFLEKNGSCAPKLGASCILYNHCPTEDSMCINEICQCSDSDRYVPSGDNMTCVEYTKKLGGSCGSDKACDHVFGSHCFQGKCQCTADYVHAEDHCRGRNGSDCYFLWGCPLDFECLEGRCYCQQDKVLSNNGEKCYPVAHALGDKCFDNDGCKTIPNTICLNDRCVCKDNYSEKAKKCLAKIGGECGDDPDCIVEASICDVSKVCKCATWYHLSEDQQSCLPNQVSVDDVAKSNYYAILVLRKIFSIDWK